MEERKEKYQTPKEGNQKHGQETNIPASETKNNGFRPF